MEEIKETTKKWLIKIIFITKLSSLITNDIWLKFNIIIIGILKIIIKRVIIKNIIT